VGFSERHSQAGSLRSQPPRNAGANCKLANHTKTDILNPEGFSAPPPQADKISKTQKKSQGFSVRLPMNGVQRGKIKKNSNFIPSEPSELQEDSFHIPGGEWSAAISKDVARTSIF